MFEETHTPDQLTEEEVEMSAFQEAITQLMLLSSNTTTQTVISEGALF